jgi:hypothetical protein
MAARIRASTKLQNSRSAAEEIAREMRTSVEEVQRLYEEEFDDLAQEARVTQYLGVLASRRVKERLRRH